MRKLFVIAVAAAGALVLFAAIVVPHWSLPVAGDQLGWRASSMIQFQPTREDEAALPPPYQPAAWKTPDLRPASSVYKNLTVLKSSNAGEVMRVMTAMTAWVSPKEGCGFCHAGGDWASDANPHKATARTMLLMTQHVNADWRGHVGAAGVTCATCHQGQPVPEDVWYAARPVPERPMIDKPEDWHEDATTVRKFFPDEGYEEYLLQNTPAVAQSYTALPTGNGQSSIVMKRLYEMMMQMSDGVGVNCGYCHNSRAFFDWKQSTPARWTGYSGMQLTRDLNRKFLLALGASMPQTRFRLTKADERNVPPHEQGALAGNALANCATCHHGRPQPAAGGLAKSYPELLGPGPGPVAAATAPAQGTAPATSSAKGG